MSETVVVALGGNAILQPGQKGTYEEQYANVEATVGILARLAGLGYRLVVSHGNGPQVGNILIQNNAANHLVPAMPLFACGAESQGLLGLMIQQALGNALARQGLHLPVATLVTQVIVDPDDPAFDNPSKPIGPFYSREEAERLMAKYGYRMKEDAGRGWRRVVASPEPQTIRELEPLTALLDRGYIVIASGGGGVPVVRRPDGTLAGIDAVIDKDLASERLASNLGADTLLILTDVTGVAVHYRTPRQTYLGRVRVGDLAGYQRDGHFASGSMAPKVEAAIRFVRNGGRRAIIGPLDHALEALAEETGTVVVA